MYCPNVRSIPFGPGPNLMILVAPGCRVSERACARWEGPSIPNMKPMINPTAVQTVSKRTRPRAESKGNIQVPIMAPIFTFDPDELALHAAKRINTITHVYRMWSAWELRAARGQRAWEAWWTSGDCSQRRGYSDCMKPEDITNGALRSEEL
jgi:hypothetical protein